MSQPVRKEKGNKSRPATLRLEEKKTIRSQRLRVSHESSLGDSTSQKKTWRKRSKENCRETEGKGKKNITPKGVGCQEIGTSDRTVHGGSQGEPSKSWLKLELRAQLKKMKKASVDCLRLGEGQGEKSEGRKRIRYSPVIIKGRSKKKSGLKSSCLFPRRKVST